MEFNKFTSCSLSQYNLEHSSSQGSQRLAPEVLTCSSATSGTDCHPAEVPSIDQPAQVGVNTGVGMTYELEESYTHGMIDKKAARTHICKRYLESTYKTYALPQ